MYLTRLSLTNFRSFGEKTQTIDFGKVTLLFGPNSVGKSTVLLALFYVQEILGKGDCNPQYIEALGDKYVGGFKNLVNGKDLNKTIKIKLEYKKSALGSSYFDVMDLIKNGDIPPKLDDDEMPSFDFALMESASMEASKIAVELEIAWTKLNDGRAYVKACNIDLDDLAIATSSSDDGLNPTITGLNYLHPLLLPDNHDDWLIDRFDSQDEIHNDLLKKVSELNGLDILSDAESELAAEKIADTLEIEAFPSSFSDDAFASEFHTLLCGTIPPSEYNNSSYMTGINFKAGDGTLLHNPLSFKNSHGALPKLGTSLITEFELSDLLQKKATDEVISDIVVAPLDNLLQLLNESLSIGPLRVIPNKAYQPDLNSLQKGWFDGSAAWIAITRSVRNFDKGSRQFPSSIQTFKKLFGELGNALEKMDPNKRKAYLEEQLTVPKELTNKLAPELRDLFDNLPNLFDGTEEDDAAFILKGVSDKLDASVAVASEGGLVKINRWLHRLGYEIVLNSSLNTIVNRGINDPAASVIDKLDNDKEREIDELQTTYSLRDLSNNAIVEPNEVGVGVSQLFPLIVAANTVSKGFVAIEQPELHVHPRVQVDVGDLLTQIADGPNFIVETHSEHIILRLLKRIRQTTDGELPEGFAPVTPDDISINYLNSSEDGVQITRLNIDEDGEFIERWPGGFFAERREEL